MAAWVPFRPFNIISIHALHAERVDLAIMTGRALIQISIHALHAERVIIGHA